MGEKLNPAKLFYDEPKWRKFNMDKLILLIALTLSFNVQANEELCREVGKMSEALWKFTREGTSRQALENFLSKKYTPLAVNILMDSTKAQEQSDASLYSYTWCMETGGKDLY